MVGLPWISLLALLSAAQAEPASPQSRDIVRSTIAHLASMNDRAQGRCLARRTAAAPFARRRSLERAIGPRPSGLRWHDAAGGGASRLRPEQEEAVARATRQVTAPGVAEPAPLDLTESDIGALSFCGPDANPRRRLSIGTPDIAGDIAFVEVNYLCAPRCGRGELYALERHRGSWRVIARAPSWIS
jgi:hypothetical protein